MEQTLEKSHWWLRRPHVARETVSTVKAVSATARLSTNADDDLILSLRVKARVRSTTTLAHKATTPTARKATSSTMSLLLTAVWEVVEVVGVADGRWEAAM